jgi:hypothetical protein
VLGAVGAENVTAPGPVTADHAYVSVPGGVGCPSSVAVPFSVTLFVGSVIAWSAPAFTTGGWFVAEAAFTVTLTSSLPISTLSLAVSRSV